MGGELAASSPRPPAPGGPGLFPRGGPTASGAPEQENGMKVHTIDRVLAHGVVMRGRAYLVLMTRDPMEGTHASD